MSSQADQADTPAFTAANRRVTVITKNKSYMTSRKQRLGNGKRQQRRRRPPLQKFKRFVEISNTFFVDAMRVHMLMAKICCVRKAIKN